MGTRTSLLFLTIVVASMLLATGCRNRSRSGRVGGTDSGMISVDSGPPDRTDGGPIVLMDSGTPPRDSGGPGVDSGPRDSGSMMCRANSISPITTQMCADSTRTCVEGCMDGTCIATCLEADPDPPSCVGCVNNNIFECFNRNGCQAQWNCLIQCTEDECSPDDTTCLDMTCAADYETYTTCGEGVPSSAMCGSTWTPCVGL